MSNPLPRRQFLAACSSACIGTTVMPNVLWAASEGGRQAVTVEMIEQAARLAGLEFAAADLAQMVQGIEANLERYRSLRTLAIDQSVPPPLYFNPAVPGQRFDDERRPFRPSPPPAVERPADAETLAFWPITDLARLIESRRLSSLELTRLYLERIERYDPVLKSVITITEELALEQASRADHEIARGNYRGPLHGIPWGAKDLLAARGYRTTWGFEPYRDQVIDTDATVVTRLEDAGAVLLAKLSTGEIARGDHWFGGQTKNPWKLDEGSGGSSAGPAAATAAGLVGFSIGTDTTGSIVGPARSCGITGLKPTFGRVSRYGVMPVCWSLDRVGPMCRTVEDCALVFEAIRGPDNRDLAVVDRPFNWDGRRSIGGIRIGYLDEAFAREVEPDDLAASRNDRATLELLKNLGATLKPCTLPEHADMDALQMLLVDEAAAFDELVHNGAIELFYPERDDPEDMLMRIARLHPAVEYLQIQRRRMLLMEGMAELFADVDVLLAPSSGSPITDATSLTGHPAVSVPNGFDDVDKPTGILLVGALYAEALVLTVAKVLQDETAFHRRHPRMA